MTPIKELEKQFSLNTNQCPVCSSIISEKHSSEHFTNGNNTYRYEYVCGMKIKVYEEGSKVIRIQAYDMCNSNDLILVHFLGLRK